MTQATMQMKKTLRDAQRTQDARRAPALEREGARPRASTSTPLLPRLRRARVECRRADRGDGRTPLRRAEHTEEQRQQLEAAGQDVEEPATAARDRAAEERATPSTTDVGPRHSIAMKWPTTDANRPHSASRRHGIRLAGTPDPSGCQRATLSALAAAAIRHKRVRSDDPGVPPHRGGSPTSPAPSWWLTALPKGLSSPVRGLVSGPSTPPP